MSFELYHQITSSSTYNYKLLELPDEILEYMKVLNQPLQFKAPLSSQNGLVICSDSKTYNVRQMNHSNTQLIMADMSVNPFGNKVKKTFSTDKTFDSSQDVTLSPTYLSVGKCTYIYEMTPTDGYIDYHDLPHYRGDDLQSETSMSSENVSKLKPLSQVLADSPISEKAFLPNWHNLLGSEVNGYAVILERGYASEALYSLISVLMAEKITRFDLEMITLAMARHNTHYSSKIIETIVGKFCQTEEDQLKLDEPGIVRWFGVETLLKQVNACSVNEFLVLWKASLPPFFNALLDLQLLRGHYCRPEHSKIGYLNRLNMSTTIFARVKELFDIVPEWDYDEFLPFVSEFIPSTKKPEAVILKYAKKKRVGKATFVCSR